MINPFSALIGYAQKIAEAFPKGTDEVSLPRVDVVGVMRLREEAGLARHFDIPLKITAFENLNPHGQRVRNALFRLAEYASVMDHDIMRSMERDLAPKLFGPGATNLGFALGDAIKAAPDMFRCHELSLDPVTDRLKGAFHLFFGGWHYDLTATFESHFFNFPITPEGIECSQAFQRSLYEEIASTFSGWFRRLSWYRLKGMGHPVTLTAGLAGLATLALIVGASRVDRGQSSTFVDS